MRPEIILVVDDEKLIRWSISQDLTMAGFTVLEAETLAQARTMIRQHEPDLLILDQRLPDGSGLDLLRELRESNDETNVIMVTAMDVSSSAVQAMKMGAEDYIIKPVNQEELRMLVVKTLDRSTERRQLQQLRKEIRARAGYESFIGASAKMKEVFEFIEKAGSSDSSTVLITGESGTGKELVARAIHLRSARKSKPLMTINCGAMPEALVESELFGHEKGAFTDASIRKKGIFELAEHSTLFLDEIGELSLPLQVKLLRAVEQKSFRRVGGTIDITVDVRIIAATNRSLMHLVREGKFREDLFYRLNVVTIHMPPLRERGSDVFLLAEHFIQEFNAKFNKRFKGLDDTTRELFKRYYWPGNVRELRNVLERATLLDEGDYIFSHHVELGHLDHLDHEDAQQRSKDMGEVSLDDLERNAILSAIRKTRGNQSEAARLLKISRDTLRYRMKKYGIS